MIPPAHMSYFMHLDYTIHSDVGTEKIPVIATWQFQWNILQENLPTVEQWKENKRKRKREEKKKQINK